jgi:hypothetical protein
MFKDFSTPTKIIMQTAIALGVIWAVGNSARIADIPFKRL